MVVDCLRGLIKNAYVIPGCFYRRESFLELETGSQATCILIFPSIVEGQYTRECMRQLLFSRMFHNSFHFIFAVSYMTGIVLGRRMENLYFFPGNFSHFGILRAPDLSPLVLVESLGFIVVETSAEVSIISAGCSTLCS